MPFSIERKTIETERLVGEGASQLLLRAEAPASGAGREAAEVLIEDAFLTLAGAEVQEGRVLASGTVRFQAVYSLGAEGDLRSAQAQASFEQPVEIDGALQRMSARVEGAVEHVEAAYESGHIVFRAAVAVRARVLEAGSVEAVTSITGEGGVEAQTEQLCSCKLNAEAASTALLEDQVSLPAQLGARVALMGWCAPVITETARDLGGARVKGNVSVETLVLTGVKARPVALVKCQLPFDQLVELPDWLEGELEASASERTLSSEVIEGGDEDSVLKLACELDIALRVRGTECSLVVTDAYSTGGAALDARFAEAPLCEGYSRVVCEDVFRGSLLLEEGAPAAGTVLAVRARPSVTEYSYENGRATINGVLEAAVLYMPAGGERLSSARGELPFSIKCASQADGATWVNVTVSNCEASALMSDRLELKCSLKVEGEARVSRVAELVVGAEEGAPLEKRYCVRVRFAQPGDTLFSVGKEYGLPTETLSALNGGSASFVAGAPLIIPAQV